MPASRHRSQQCEFNGNIYILQPSPGSPRLPVGCRELTVWQMRNHQHITACRANCTADSRAGSTHFHSKTVKVRKPQWCCRDFCHLLSGSPSAAARPHATSSCALQSLPAAKQFPCSPTLPGSQYSEQGWAQRIHWLSVLSLWQPQNPLTPEMTKTINSLP